MDFPPCRLVFAEELLVAGLGPRTAFGRDRLGRARAPPVARAKSHAGNGVRALGSRWQTFLGEGSPTKVNYRKKVGTLV